ncbi:MAG: serpin family protein [Minwuia sp.]|nr:serpin family protein [Minwuia sp.]
MRHVIHRTIPAVLIALGFCLGPGLVYKVLAAEGPDVAARNDAALDTLAPERRIAVGLERLGFCLGAAALDQKPGENALIAPLGAARVLDMIGQGSPLPVRQAIARTLGWTTFLAGSFASRVYAEKVSAQAAAQDDVSFGLATGIWHAPTHKPRLHFANAAGKDLMRQDFAAPDTVAAINAWISDRTDGQITSALADIPRDTVLLIADALAFSGAWAQPFDSQETTTAVFSDKSPMAAQVAMMHAPKLLAAHIHNDSGDLVALPLGDGTFEALLVLPGPAGLRGFAKIACHRTGGIEAPDPKADLHSVDLSMPRFKVEGSVEVDRLLHAAGLGEALDHPLFGAAMTTPPTRPGQIQQHVTLHVDEAGAKVAAATLTIGTRAAVEPVKVTLDRPFAILIRQRESGLPVLVGLINRPTPVEGTPSSGTPAK